MAKGRTLWASSLRTSILASLGLLAAACGGTTTEPGNDAGGSGAALGRPAALGQCTWPSVDPKTHLTTCREGYAHRPVPVRCDGAKTSSDAAPAVPSACGGDDCSRLPNGYCVFGSDAPHCASGCIEDTDCGAGFVCSCASSQSPTGGECLPADCNTDADCDNSLCVEADTICGIGRFACQRDADECRSNGDCRMADASLNARCVIGESGHNQCFNGTCGRPFLVNAGARIAAPMTRPDWNIGSPCPRVDHLSPTERLTLAEHWTKMGQMEHASIAAFARFSLQLLSLGAPPELVEACTAALADETAHTKLCFGIASAYAGRAIGPGPLDISGSLAVTSLADVVDLVIAEGCVGETDAALEALQAADSAADPVIVAAYSQIAADEQRHAELAFRFVSWALERDYHAVAQRIQAAVGEGAFAGANVRDVAAPCLEALLAIKLVA